MKAVILMFCVASIAGAPSSPPGHQLKPIEQLGKDLFFDPNLSNPTGQACAACHAPEVGFTGPLSAINGHGAVYEGAFAGRFGNRKPPTAAYAGESPVLYFDEEEEVWLGGMFWDGRATGWRLGDPLAEQAQGPFLNPLEQNMASPAAVVEKVRNSAYANLFREVWGAQSLNAGNESTAYEQIARSIARYERSKEVNPFSSKYDAYLEGKARLSKLEKEGLRLFLGKGQCAACHAADRGKSNKEPLFTDFSYDNLGLPRNPENPFYDMADFNSGGDAWVDPGLGGFLYGAGFGKEVYEAEWGKHKVPTLRNVAKTPYPEFVKAYGHNGVFKSLKDIIHFYNTRDVAIWPDPEIPQNVNRTELGDLGLSDAEEDAIVAFLETLSDGYTP